MMKLYISIDGLKMYTRQDFNGMDEWLTALIPYRLVVYNADHITSILFIGFRHLTLPNISIPHLTSGVKVTPTPNIQNMID